MLEIARSASGICLSQRKYALSLLEDTCFLNAKPTSLPMDPNLKLNSSDGELLKEAFMYRRLIGRLMYLTISRPNITYAVTKLSHYMSSPQVRHLDALHHFLRYIKHSPSQGLLFSAKSQLALKGYADADWCQCLDTRRSTTGMCVFLCDSLVSWKSKKQTTISCISPEVGYRSLAAIASEITSLTALLKDFEIEVSSAMVFYDNQSAIHLSTKPSFHERSKHVEIDCHFIW